MVFAGRQVWERLTLNICLISEYFLTIGPIDSQDLTQNSFPFAPPHVPSALCGLSELPLLIRIPQPKRFHFSCAVSLVQMSFSLFVLFSDDTFWIQFNGASSRQPSVASPSSDLSSNCMCSSLMALITFNFVS